jgi:hypothetical protein
MSSKKRSKKKTNTGSSSDMYRSTQPQFNSVPALPVSKINLHTLQFENEFGRIKSKVEHIVEHDQAYMLIFSDTDAMVFEPKVGESLLLHLPDKTQVNVYYPGVTFDSPESSKKFMILFKLPEENQE